MIRFTENPTLGIGEDFAIIKPERGLSYQDIYLIPNKGIVKSRSECDTSVQFGPRIFSIPVVPANMKTVVDVKTCMYLAKQNIFYIMHRFDVDLISFYDIMRRNDLFVSISIGVKDESIAEYTNLIKSGRIPEYVTIDIAHGHSLIMKETIEYVKKISPSVFLIAGNVATAKGVLNLEEWGADATKCGIANGQACTTFNSTGVGRPQYSTNLHCTNWAKKPVIVDGGVKEIGDIVKGIHSGGTMVMCGSLFAGYDESAGEIIRMRNGLRVTEFNTPNDTDEKFKEYYGSASEENKGKHEHVEGRKLLVKYNGPMCKLLGDIKDGISSAISYAGGKDLSHIINMRYGIK